MHFERELFILKQQLCAYSFRGGKGISIRVGRKYLLIGGKSQNDTIIDAMNFCSFEHIYRGKPVVILKRMRNACSRKEEGQTYKDQGLIRGESFEAPACHFMQNISQLAYFIYRTQSHSSLSSDPNPPARSLAGPSQLTTKFHAQATQAPTFPFTHNFNSFTNSDLRKMIRNR